MENVKELWLCEEYEQIKIHTNIQGLESCIFKHIIKTPSK
jgi:hypothetical protein